ncbi:insulinase family protein [Pirellulaceae bacterium]|jgi:zinc protease|nr:insulinase family protein [Pirellulaceae bacterium]
MKRVIQQALATSLVLTLIIVSVAKAETKELVTIEGITSYEMDNGLQLLLYPDDSASTVTVNMTVFVGSRHEGYGETGMAHLLEHMLFKGTPTFSNIPALLNEKGARFNGTTWLDRTNYYETLPASDENLKLAIHLESDRMMNSYIKGEDLQSEFSVVRSEFERGENSPSRVLMQRMQSAAFDWHNYGKSTIGNKSDIELVPLPRLRAFYKKYYQPDNTMVVVAGRFDKEKALEYLDEYFGKIPTPERKLERTYTIEPPQDGERIVNLRRVGEVGIAGVLYHVPASAHPDFAAVDVLSYILSTEPAGRLYKTLVETKVASNIVGGTYALHDPGVMLFYSQATEKENITKVRDIILAEINKIVTDGVTEDEVKRVIQQLTKQREQSLNNTSQIAIDLSDWAAQGDWRLFFLYRDRFEKVTPQDVQRVATLYTRPENRTIGMFIPTNEPSYITIPDTGNIAAMVEGYKGREAVAQGEKFEATLDNIEKRTDLTTLQSGIQAALLPKKSRGEQVVLNLSLNFGTLESLKGYDVAATYIGPLMLRGTKNKTHQQIQDELDALGATLSISSSTGSLDFSILAKKDTLPKVLALAKEIIENPSFPEEELQVMLQQRITSLEASKSEPQSLAMNLLAQKLTPYPVDDIRATLPVEGQIEQLKGVTIDDVIKLFKEQVGNQSGELIAVGDFDIEEVTPIIQDAVRTMSSDITYQRIGSTPFLEIKGGQETILTPDKKNAFYISAHQIPVGRLHPDYPALLIGNHILGGGALSSRLADRVRQQEGLSYTVGSMYRTYAKEGHGRVMIYAISNPDNSDKVVKVVNEELTKLITDGVTEEEVTKAVESNLQSSAVSRSTDSGIAGMLGSLLAQDRDIQSTKDLEDQMMKLTPEQVNSAIRKYLKPEKLIIITAGDFKKD